MDPSAEVRDPNVFSFMQQLVQEKNGEDMDADSLETEAGRLYDIFGDWLLLQFEPQLKEEQKAQFDQLVENNEDQDILMSYLMQNIPNIEEQIIQLLVAFRTDYITGKFEAAGEKTNLE